MGFAVGCIEGRVAVEYFAEMGKRGHYLNLLYYSVHN